MGTALHAAKRLVVRRHLFLPVTLVAVLVISFPASAGLSAGYCGDPLSPITIDLNLSPALTTGAPAEVSWWIPGNSEVIDWDGNCTYTDGEPTATTRIDLRAPKATGNGGLATCDALHLNGTIYLDFETNTSNLPFDGNVEAKIEGPPRSPVMTLFHGAPTGSSIVGVAGLISNGCDQGGTNSNLALSGTLVFVDP